jgi:thioesterase domain-containing protein/acyl carrier protein
VRKAAVILAPGQNENGNNNGDDGLQLIACLPALDTSDTEPQNEGLRRALSTALPDFMVPARFVAVEQWPLLPGGKLDRIALARLVTERDGHAMQNESTPLPDAFVARLQHIWQKALRVNNIGEHDDFFAFGGHSLAAADICTAIHQEFNLDVPLAALAQFPTLSRFSRALRGGEIQRHPRMIRLKASGEGAPFFCVPGAGSDAFSLMELGRHLKSPRPFYALQPPGLDGHASYPQTVEEFAAYNMETLRELQPHGPYFLCGSSFGGIVVFEMARILRSHGEQVALLAMLDSYGVGYPRPRRDLRINRAALWAWHCLPLGDKQWTPRHFTRGLKQRADERRARKELTHGQRSHARRFLHLRMACFAAKKRYSPSVFDGEIHLFRVEIQATAKLFEPDMMLGWDGLASHGVVVHVLPGKHNSYLKEPNVRLLAFGLDSLLTTAGH